MTTGRGCPARHAERAEARSATLPLLLACACISMCYADMLSAPEGPLLASAWQLDRGQQLSSQSS